MASCTHMFASEVPGISIYTDYRSPAQLKGWKEVEDKVRPIVSKFLRTGAAAPLQSAAPLAYPQLSPDVFRIEDSQGLSVVTSRPLPAGAVVSFRPHDLKPDETLLFHRCGDDCATTKLISQWTRRDFQNSMPNEVVLTEGGHYYFWIRRELTNGEVGPVPLRFVLCGGSGCNFVFKSLTQVAVQADTSGVPSK